MTEVREMTAEEWDGAMQSALDKLGCTYEELADMARRRDFASIEHRKLGVVIGGTVRA